MRRLNFYYQHNLTTAVVSDDLSSLVLFIKFLTILLHNDVIQLKLEVCV